MLALVFDRHAAGTRLDGQISCCQFSIASRSQVPAGLQRSCWSQNGYLKASLGWVLVAIANKVAISVLRLHNNSGLQ